MTDESPSDVRRPLIGGSLTAALLVLSLIAWPIAFNLGAYGQVLYPDVFKVLVAASILLVVTMVNRPFDRRRNVAGCLALAAPLAWFTGAVLIAGSTGAALDRPLFAAALVFVVLVSIPVTLRLLIGLFHPELTAGTARSLTLAVIGLVAAVAAIGFVFGRANDRIMTCTDFDVAGASRPDNCAPESP